jgi:malate dehydrogenase (oxaloacetate-decarboxylating)
MRREHAPDGRRAAVAHGRPITQREHRRDAPTFKGESRVPDGINTAMNAVEATGLDAARDAAVADAGVSKLRRADHAVLVRCDPRGHSVPIGGFRPHTGHKPPGPVSLPFIAGVRAREAPGGAPYDQRAMAASAQYSVTVRVELDARQEPLGKLTAQIVEAGGALVSVDLVPGAGDEGKRVREFTVDANSPEHWEEILRSIGSTRGARVLGFTDRTFEMHKKGKIEQHNKYPLKTRDDLSMAYTPGVARVCEYIAEDKTKAFDFTIKANTVAVVTDGSAVLGLGDIGPEAAMPVMEGKAMLFKEFAEVDAFPVCLATNDPEEIIQTVELISPTFGGINLEDISAPRCFEIEDRLKEELDIPVFHDDQHGTAVVVMAALFNALKIVQKPIDSLRVLMLGLGAAGVACTKMMQESGITEIIGCDRQGAISTDRFDYVDGGMSPIKSWYAENSNPEKLSGGPNEVIEGCDLFIGLSGPGLVEPESLAKMNDDAIVFAMANPTPEVMPEEAEQHVRIMATGRSDYPNQINNVLCFPGIFRGALDAGAPRITEEMKLAAARGIAEVVTDDDLAEDYIIPSVFNRDVAASVARAVVDEAKAAGLARFSEETGTFEVIGSHGAAPDTDAG